MNTFYQEGWAVHQQRLTTALATLTNEQLALSLLPHWSIGRITAHIIAARVWWLVSRAGEGNTNLASLEQWDATGAPLRTIDELLGGLSQTWEVIDEVLRRWSLADLEQTLPSHPNDPMERTKRWIIWHVLEHDIHHGGEISLTLGVHGLAIANVLAS